MTTLINLTAIDGGKGPPRPRRPYDRDDRDDLRDKIYDVIDEWADTKRGGVRDLAQIDCKRMALHALTMSIAYIEDVGETSEDIRAFKSEVVAELEAELAAWRGQPLPPKPDNCRGRSCDEGIGIANPNGDRFTVRRNPNDLDGSVEIVRRADIEKGDEQ